MSTRTRGRMFGALKVAGIATVFGWALVLTAGPALADPEPPPGDPGVVVPPAGPPPPKINPANGATVGVAQPIIIDLPAPVDDAGAAESAVHISSSPPVEGKFYWQTPTQLRWRPLSFWPAHTAVTVDALGA